MLETEWVTRQELAERYPIKYATWSRWAYLGTGPSYSLVGKHALYRLRDVERWLDEHRVEARS